MALRFQEKQRQVEELAAAAADSVSLVAADFTRLDVQAMTELRASARANGVYLKVMKNTLIQRALQDTDYEVINEQLSGPTLLAFSQQEPGSAARILREFRKDHEHLQIRLIAIGGQVLDGKALDAVAKLPTRDEALATLMGAMKAPLTKLVQTLAAPHGKLVRTLAAVREQKSQGDQG